MAAPAVIAAIILLIVALILIISYTLWLNTSNEACVNNLNAIIRVTTNIIEDPANANLHCAGVKQAIILFDAQCPDFSTVPYSAYVPPCP